MAKYITYNKIIGKKYQQTTSNYELAVNRCEKGGYVVLKLSGKNVIMYDKRSKIKND